MRDGLTADAVALRDGLTAEVAVPRDGLMDDAAAPSDGLMADADAPRNDSDHSVTVTVIIPCSASVRLACPVKCEDSCHETCRRGASPLTTHVRGYRAQSPIHMSDGAKVTDPQGT